MDVKCNVSECHYNKNMLCKASSIKVGHSGVSCSTQPAQTQCDTFSSCES